MDGVLDKLQRKDKHDIFAEPVTEDLAPDYFDYIKRPMDFRTIRAKAANNEYATWADMKADVDQMYKNAMIYNTKDTLFYSIAESSLKVSAPMTARAHSTPQTVGHVEWTRSGHQWRKGRENRPVAGTNGGRGERIDL
eukprot:1187331-Pyramimonas_sp.AAC.2